MSSLWKKVQGALGGAGAVFLAVQLLPVIQGNVTWQNIPQGTRFWVLIAAMLVGMSAEDFLKACQEPGVAQAIVQEAGK